MSLRDLENPIVIRDRWEASMFRGTSHPIRLARPVRDIEMARARDAANDAGANAWSPSRAREALRERLVSLDRYTSGSVPSISDRAFRVERVAEDQNIFEDERDFKRFWFSEFGRHFPR